MGAALASFLGMWTFWVLASLLPWLGDDPFLEEVRFGAVFAAVMTLLTHDVPVPERFRRAPRVHPIPAGRVLSEPLSHVRRTDQQ